ncbi:MAG: class I SAM-dependent methyltransferase [Chloroflexi bacterium]|nr:class I SAM-dependent methyltransferase [Chloroflexota bacterium]
MATPFAARWLTDNAGEEWARNAALRARYMAATTELMLRLAHIRPAARVLDLACGTGDQTIEAANLAGPDGWFLATDMSPSMVRVAEQALAKAGVKGEARVLDMQAASEQLEAASFDAAICRFGLMFMPDLQRALSGIRGALKPGSRFAAAVWSTSEKNPFMGLGARIVRRLQGLPPEEPVTSSLAAPGKLAGELTRAGFSAVEVHPVPVMRDFPSAAEAVRLAKAGELQGFNELRDLLPADRERAWLELEAELKPFDGPHGCVVPGESLVGVGTA